MKKLIILLTFFVLIFSFPATVRADVDVSCYTPVITKSFDVAASGGKTTAYTCKMYIKFIDTDISEVKYIARTALHSDGKYIIPHYIVFADCPFEWQLVRTSGSSESLLSSGKVTSVDSGGHSAGFYRCDASPSAYVVGKLSNFDASYGSLSSPLSSSDFEEKVYKPMADFFFSGGSVGGDGEHSGGDVSSGTDSPADPNSGFDFSGIISSISDFAKSFGEGISSVIELIKDLPRLFLDMLKSLFIPADNALELAIDKVKNQLNVSFGLDSFDVDLFQWYEKPLENAQGTVDVGAFKFSGTFVDYSMVIKTVATFKPYIRGILYFLLLLYNFNQFLWLIGSPAISIFGSSGSRGTSDNGNDKKE